jgi:hypothetical protein
VVREDAVAPPEGGRVYRVERFKKAATISEAIDARWLNYLGERKQPSRGGA